MTNNPVIDDRVWKALRKKIADVGRHHVRVGVFASAGSEKGTTIADIAAIHEFGAPKANIPARSFLRSAFTNDGGAALRAMSERVARSILSEKIDLRRALDALGAWAANAVKVRIRSNIAPALAKATIVRKGSSKALIDTGRLMNAITWVVGE